MKIQTKIYIAVAAAFLAVIAGNAAWSGIQVSRLEKEVREARVEADASAKEAARRELEAAEYKQKIEYLESRIAGIRTTARKQDEQLEKNNIDSRDARRALGRARGTRSIDSTADELCQKLARAGHPCD